MKVLSVASALVTFLASSTLVDAKLSKPFYLVAISDNDKVNGTAFDACHSGAAIEGLCVGFKIGKTKKEFISYRLRTDSGEPNFGALEWTLISGKDHEKELMQFYLDPSTNVALPLFEPTEEPTNVGFDSEDRMYLSSGLDDTVSPPTFTHVRKLYRWYTCKTYYTGYTYKTLNWVQGKYPPENPTCEKVEVVRQFV